MSINIELREYYDKGEINLHEIIKTLEPSSPERALLLLHAFLLLLTSKKSFDMENRDNVPMLELWNGYIKELADGKYEIPQEEAINACRSAHRYDEAFLLANSWGFLKLAWDVLFQDRNDPRKALEHLSDQITLNPENVSFLVSI